MEVDTAKAVESSVDNIVAGPPDLGIVAELAWSSSRSGQDIIAKCDDSTVDKVEKLVKDNYAIVERRTGSRASWFIP